MKFKKLWFSPSLTGSVDEVSEHFCCTMLHISNSRTDNSGKCYQSLKALWQNSKLKHCVSHVHVHWESLRHDCRFYLKFMTIMIKSMVIDFFVCFFFGTTVYFLIIFLDSKTRQAFLLFLSLQCFLFFLCIMKWVRQQQCYYFPYLHVLYSDSTHNIHVLLSIWS